MKRKSRIILLVLVLLSAALGIGVWSYRPRGNVSNNVPVSVNVVRRDLTSQVLATGVVKPQIGAEVRVGSRISGKVERLFANISDGVKKGQVIAQLEKADLEAIVNVRSAELQMAEAKLAAIKSLRPREIEKAKIDVDRWLATVELNRKELSRQEELLKQDFTSEQARDRAKEQLAVSEAQIASVRKTLELTETGYEEDIRQAVADLERAKALMANDIVQLSYATITAPIDGVVGSVSTQEGETVAAGLNAPTFVTIIDLARLQVDTFVDEVDIGKIIPDQRAVFIVDSFPAREFEGKVVAIYPKAVIQDNVVNYDVVVKIIDPYYGVLRPEMTASVTIFLETRKNVLTLPVKAIKRYQGKNVVYLISSSGIQIREVKIGWKDSQWIEILSGLDEGETVLLESPSAQ